MSQFYKNILLIISVFAFSLPAMADMVSHSPSCSKPYKPTKITTQSDKEKFDQSVNDYKKCITDFVDKQQEAAQRHQESASNAIDVWNNYVNFEYNK